MLECRPVQRGAIVAGLDNIPPRDAFAFNDRLAYCGLSEQQAQCLAATNASLARSLEQEAAAIGAQKEGHHGADVATQQQILHLQATHERNRAASAALQLFLRLAEAEGGVHNARQRSLEVNQMVSDVHRLQAAGLDPPVSLSTIQAQQLDLVHKQVDLEATIDQLNHQLIKLLGAEPPPHARLWPEADLLVLPTVPSVAESQQIALSQRADLCALRVAASANDPRNLDITRALLGQSGVGLGMALHSCASMFSMFHHKARREEAAIRQAQLAGTLADQERQARHDVAEALATLQARLIQIGLTQRRLEMLQNQHQRLERARPVEVAAGFEARKAHLDSLAAEQDLLHDVIEWKLAWVKLREAQGALAIECGFTAGLQCAASPCAP
jgi:outer membrane protein TolC